MATSRELFRQITEGRWDAALSRLYGSDPARLARERARYCDALCQFQTYYGPNRQVRLFSSPGRTEIGGNHTDHQNGVALGAAVDLDILAVASPAHGELIRVKSRGFDKLDVIDLAAGSPQAGESTHSASLVRGIAQEYRAAGNKAGGFDAYTTSDVLRGSGLSSSAAFEMVIAAILNGFYNGGSLSALEMARAAQQAENLFFGKPSGLLDPLTCALGGAICVDFKMPEKPLIRHLDADLAGAGLCMCITDTHGSHSEMTAEFASIRKEMETISHFFGKSTLRGITERQLLQSLPALRLACGDRAALRALHYFAECRYVRAEYHALQKRHMAVFLKLITESGHSAFEYNQNAYCISEPGRQAIPVALAVSQSILRGRGACRLQGSGFAGTIQAFVPKKLAASYRAALDGVFGTGSCRIVNIRTFGTVEVDCKTETEPAAM